MRVLVLAKLPLEPFNSMVKHGTAGKRIQEILAEQKPEATYFMDWDGHRTAVMIMDLADPSRIPSIAEPWFLSFGAHLEIKVAMTPEDLGKAGLEGLGKKWA